MGCVNAKVSAPSNASPIHKGAPTLLERRGSEFAGHSIGKGAVATMGVVAHGASSAAHAVGSGVKGVGIGSVDAVAAVSHTARQAVHVAGDGLQHFGGSAASIVCQAGQGAKDTANVLGHGAHLVGSEAVGVARQAGQDAVDVAKRLGSLPRQADKLQAEPQLEKAWYLRLCETFASLDLGVCCCQPPSGSNILGSLVQKVFAQFDTSALGVKVEIGSLALDPASGRAEVSGLTVHNPEGYCSEYLLHADKVVVDIDMEKLLCSCGKELHIEELIFDGIDVIYEQGLHGSNLHDLLKRLKASEANEASEAKPRRPSTQAGAESSPDVKLVMHSILLQNIGAKLATKLTRGHGLRLEVGSLAYDDFDAQMGAGRGLMDIVHILLSTLIKSVLATVVGKQGTKAMTGAAHAAADTLTHAGGQSLGKVKAALFRGKE